MTNAVRLEIDGNVVGLLFATDAAAEAWAKHNRPGEPFRLLSGPVDDRTVEDHPPAE